MLFLCATQQKTTNNPLSEGCFESFIEQLLVAQSFFPGKHDRSLYPQCLHWKVSMSAPEEVKPEMELNY